jgi:hypothetical protein
MARKIVVGHGGFDTTSEMLLVPPDTTITFLADAGSNLALPSVSILPPGQAPGDGVWVEGVHSRFDYAKVANLLDKYLEAEKPRKAYDVVPNMSIEPLGAESVRVARELDEAGKWGGEVVWTTGVARLCDGNDRTCPSPMLNVADRNHPRLSSMDSEKVEEFKKWVEDGATGALPEGFSDFAAPELTNAPDLYYRYVVDGVPDDAWSHDCTGIFGKAVLGGNDIVWLSCSGFVANQDDLDALGLSEGLPSTVTAATHGPGADWNPADKDLDRIATLNAKKVKDTPDGESTGIRVGGVLVLIGSDHEANEENYVKRQGNFTEGELTVKKGGAFSKGSVTITGIGSGAQSVVKDAIESFSDKKVAFA